MEHLRNKKLQSLCVKHGLLAAILFQQAEITSWLGNLSQTDYAHLLWLGQIQTLPLGASRVDAVQLSTQAVLLHSQLLDDGNLALLVFAFTIRLKEIDQKAGAFLQEIEKNFQAQKQESLLQGLKPRQVSIHSSSDDDLLALFSAMPEADPSNDATQPFRVSTIQVQTLDKSATDWKQIF